MATDIMDPDLKKARNARWEVAFCNEQTQEAPLSENPNTTKDCDSVCQQNRKATIVLEHLMQASDVAHTMQHWHVYRKWNERLFFEMAHSYQVGRAPRHPSEFWYEGEIRFFDFYV